jgi:hypothetical protein
VIELLGVIVMVKFVLVLTVLLFSACAPEKREKYKLRMKDGAVVCSDCVDKRDRGEDVSCTKCACCFNSADLCCCLHWDKCTCNPSVCGVQK